MTDSITINFDRLFEKIQGLRREGTLEAHTTDIIERYMGGFHSNRGVPVKDSWNAQFGKYLKTHEAELRILELAKKERVGSTSASRWSLTLTPLPSPMTTLEAG